MLRARSSLCFPWIFITTDGLTLEAEKTAEGNPRIELALKLVRYWKMAFGKGRSDSTPAGEQRPRRIIPYFSISKKHIRLYIPLRLSWNTRTSWKGIMRKERPSASRSIGSFQAHSLHARND